MSCAVFNPLGVGKRLEASSNYGVYEGRPRVCNIALQTY